MFYKPVEEGRLLRRFQEDHNSSCSSVEIREPDKIEEILDFSFSVLATSCQELEEEYSKGSVEAIFKLSALSTFFIENRLRILNNGISVAPFIDMLENYHIGNIIFEFITVGELNELTLQALETAIHFIAILAYFPSSNFEKFLSGARLYPIIFDWFCNCELLDASRELAIDMLSLLINLSYAEEQQEEPFIMFKADSKHHTGLFAEAFNFRNSKFEEKIDGMYGIRVFTEIAKKNSQYFDIEECEIVKSFISDNLTEDSYFYALRFAFYLMDKYYATEDGEKIAFLFFDAFNGHFFELCERNTETQKQELIYFVQFFQCVDDFNPLLSILSSVPLFTYMKNMLSNADIVCSVLSLTEALIDKRGNIEVNGRPESICLFDLFIKTQFKDNIGNFILLLQSEYDDMCVSAKVKSFEIFSKLMYNNKAARIIISKYNFENIENVIESASKEISLSAINFVSTCLDITGRMSPAAAQEFISKLNECDMSSVFDELIDNDDEEISIAAQRVVDQVNYFEDDEYSED